MSELPESQGGTQAPVFVEDVLLTDVFLIKGRLPNKSKRLTNILEDHTRAFLHVQDATMVALRSSEVIRTPSVMVNMREIIFAHELVEIAGDEIFKRLAQHGKQTRIRAFYNGLVQFELSGGVEPGAYETTGTTGRKFFIMHKPSVRGIDLDSPELALLKKLDYAIVRKDRMSYVYDFG